MSEIKVDTLTGKTTANDITVTVGATATQSLEQGLAKAWVRFDASSGTPTANDSLNFSSFTDHNAGKHRVFFNNSMGNANYAWSGGGSNQGTDSRHIFNNNDAPATASFRLATTNSSNTSTDGTYNSLTIHGDLA